MAEDEFRQIGRARNFSPPLQAKELKASDYYFCYPVPSNKRPKTCVDKVGLHCPHCENVMELPDHGDAWECNTCFTKIQIFGNRLYTWI